MKGAHYHLHPNVTDPRFFAAYLETPEKLKLEVTLIPGGINKWPYEIFFHSRKRQESICGLV